MADELTTLRTLLDDIARRRAAVARRRGWVTGALVATAALVAARVVLWMLAPTGGAFVLLVALAVAVGAGAIIVALRASRTTSTPIQLARLVEEREGGLDDVVVTAVDYAARPDHSGPIADRLASAALRAAGTDAAEIVLPSSTLRVAGQRSLAAAAALVAALVFMAGPLRDATDIASAYLIPSRLAIVVEPGNVRVRAGRPVTIRARVRGSAALAPALVAGTGPDAVPIAMTPGADGAFEAVVADVTATFAYHVEVGARSSDAYTVTVVHPARVERIDLDYAYPAALGLPARREDDGGDIYAPEGTAVTLRITADRAVGAGALLLGDGTRVPLGVDGTASTGQLTISADGSYRIAFVDDDGVEMADDTEYFIRTLLDRPPDVRVLRPAGDKQVTPLEEVLIEARADDDFGVRSFDLVLQKPGDAEVVVPLRSNAGGLTMNGRHTLYLEDLEVAPGDVVSYFVRASDIGRGKPSSESRSDIFFLEVKAFNDEFVAAQSQAMAAGAQAQGVQDLAAAQKEIVVATWKLDSRGKRANRAGSTADIKAIADAQRALEQRAAKEAGSQMQAAGATGSPRRRRGRATIESVSDDPMGLAIEAMRRATAALDKLQTGAAMPHEMEALNQLLRAESEVRRRQVARQQGGGGGGGNRTTPDLSALFDQELRKQQQTNYETPASSETRQDARPEADPLERLRELARRQEALSREQQDLARSQQALDAEALKRRLERLTRDQEELRRQLEQLSREMPQRNERRDGEQTAERQAGAQPQGEQSGQQQGQQPGQQGQQGQQQASGRGQQSGASRQSGQSGQSGQSPEGRQPANEQQAVREAVDEMRQASSGLRDQDASRASESAGRALERMRRAEEALRGSTAGDMRRQLGDVQLEARQLADAQRRLSEELRNAESSGTPGAGQTGNAAGSRGRQLGAEQERLAARADRLRQRMRDLSQQARGSDGRATLDQAGREMEAGRTSELMRDAARALSGAGAKAGERSSAAGSQASASTTTPRPGASGTPSAQEAAQQAARLGDDAARALDRVAERLDGRRTGDAAAASRLSDDLSKTRQLREQLDTVERSLEQLRAQEGRSAQRAERAETSSSRAQDGRPAGTPGQRGGDGRAADGEVTRLQQQLADDMRQAREQVDALGRASPEMRGPSTPESWQPSVSAPGTEAFKQDFARWESLKQSLLFALEKVERGLADELRQQESRDRLNAGASDAVPDDYRKLVDKYYRSLATPRRPER